MEFEYDQELEMDRAYALAQRMMQLQMKHWTNELALVELQAQPELPLGQAQRLQQLQEEQLQLEAAVAELDKLRAGLPDVTLGDPRLRARPVRPDVNPVGQT